MKTIISADSFSELYYDSVMHKDAFPTNRVVGKYLQEWAEPCIIRGAPAKIYYLFDECADEIQEDCDLPFDIDHAVKIEIAEKDDDGKYETI